MTEECKIDGKRKSVFQSSEEHIKRPQIAKEKMRKQK
jgi:hypothetical protein